MKFEFLKITAPIGIIQNSMAASPTCSSHMQLTCMGKAYIIEMMHSYTLPM